MEVLTFTASSHSYFWDGKPVPGVTSILKPLVSLDHIPQATLERARQEGVATHKMVELDAAGTLDVAALPEWMAPVYKAWSDFKDASGFTPILSEHKGYHPHLGYAGTLDLLCEVPRLKGWKGVALIDVKRSLYAGAVIGLQLAAYRAIVESDKAMPKVSRRAALRLGNDGKFRLEPYDDPSDFAVFLSLLNVKRWKESHGHPDQA